MTVWYLVPVLFVAHVLVMIYKINIAKKLVKLRAEEEAAARAESEDPDGEASAPVRKSRNDGTRRERQPRRNSEGKAAAAPSQRSESAIVPDFQMDDWSHHDASFEVPPEFYEAAPAQG